MKRLRKFANIALWCGNNEADEAWHNWGYHRNPTFSKADSANMWEGYKTIFHKILPETVATCDSSMFYLSTSPLYGWGREKSMTHGSAHYWGVWWGVEPYETYLRKVPRFMSEFGLQAMPALSTIRAFQTQKFDTLFSPWLQCHQKHPTGYETISKYLKMENLDAKTIEDYIYMSQLVQAKGIGLGIEAQRKAKPRCMGSLYWQLNDCWPVVSWSSTDFYGNAKALQYKAKQLFDYVMISVIMQNDSVDISIVSDRLQTVNGKFSINAITPEGNYRSVLEQEISIIANGVLNVKKNSRDKIFRDIDLSTTLVEARFEALDGTAYFWKGFLVKIGDIKIPSSDIDLQFTRVPNGYSIKLSTNSLAPYVQLYLTDTHAKFDRNFIHLVPGKTETIFCKTQLSEIDFKKQLRIKSLGNNNR